MDQVVPKRAVTCLEAWTQATQTLSIESGKRWLTEWASTTPKTDLVSVITIMATEAMAVVGATQDPTSSQVTTGKHLVWIMHAEGILFHKRHEL